MCECLGRFIKLDGDDGQIQFSLGFVWVIVEGTLSEDPEVIERLVDRNEFEANVKKEGEEKVIELLRDTAKNGSWLEYNRNQYVHHSDIL